MHTLFLHVLAVNQPPTGLPEQTAAAAGSRIGMASLLFVVAAFAGAALVSKLADLVSVLGIVVKRLLVMLALAGLATALLIGAVGLALLEAAGSGG